MAWQSDEASSPGIATPDQVISSLPIGLAPGTAVVMEGGGGSIGAQPITIMNPQGQVVAPPVMHVPNAPVSLVQPLEPFTFGQYVQNYPVLSATGPAIGGAGAGFLDWLKTITTIGGTVGIGLGTLFGALKWWDSDFMKSLGSQDEGYQVPLFNTGKSDFGLGGSTTMDFNKILPFLLMGGRSINLPMLLMLSGTSIEKLLPIMAMQRKLGQGFAMATFGVLDMNTGLMIDLMRRRYRRRRYNRRSYGGSAYMRGALSVLRNK